MNFSEQLRLSGGHLAWSSNGLYVATPVSARLEIRDGATLQVFLTFNCTDVIQAVEWAPDSNYILTTNYKRCVVEVWSLLDIDWRCKINEGAIGLVHVCWSPDSRHVLTMAEFNLRITVWSLVNKSVSYIKNPKKASPGYQFSPDSEYLAVAERKQLKDWIGLLETKSWQLVKHFEVDTRDLAGLSWASDSSVIAVWESALEYRILVYSLGGQCLTSFSAYEWALGIKGVSWSPSGQFLAVGSYDQKVRILNHITWKVLAEFNHTTYIENEKCIIFKEEEKPLTGYPATLASVQGFPLVQEASYEEETTRPVILTSIEVGKQASPRIGISSLAFSADNRYLATRCDNMPAVIWIWSIPKLCLKAVLVQSSVVKDMAWDPRQPRLAICTGNSRLFFWSPFGCVAVVVPGSPLLQGTSIKWHPSGSRLAVIGKDQYSVCFLDAQLCSEQNYVQ